MSLRRCRFPNCGITDGTRVVRLPFGGALVLLCRRHRGLFSRLLMRALF